MFKKCISNVLVLALMLSLIASGGLFKVNTVYASTTTYYVDTNGNDSTGTGTISNPFKSVAKAKDVVRARIAGGMSNDITVYIREGIYYQDSKVTFNSSDSGRDGYKVTYSNYPGETVEINGGQRITGWTLHSGNIYKKSVGTGWNFNYLSENGVKSTLARHPNIGYNTVSEAYTSDIKRKFYFGSGSIPNISNITDLQASIWPGGPHGEWNWYQYLYDISSINNSSRVVTISSDANYDLGAGTRYFVQGAIELLDQPGEFYLDSATGILYYWPLNSNIESQQIVAAKTTRIFEFEGSSSSDFVQNIVIDGIDLNVSDYNKNFSDLFVGDAMISLENAKYITVSNCEIKNGGSNGIALYDYSQNNTFSGNLIHEVGKSGITMSGVNTLHNTVTGNHIYNVGQVNGHGAGVESFQNGYNTISYNRIHGSKRFGIASYGAGVNNSVFEYNDVFDCMNDSQDGSVFYIWGASTGQNTVQYNLFHDTKIHFSFGFGYYLDDDTSYTNTRNNIIYNLQKTKPGSGVLATNLLIKGLGNKTYNNIIADNPNTEWGSIHSSKNITGTSSKYHEYGKNISYKSSDPAGVLHVADLLETGRYSYSDNNFIYNANGVYNAMQVYGQSVIGFPTWRNTYGFDQNTITGQDPLFMNPENADYRLRYDSPAYNIGFEDINAEYIGLKSDFRFTDNSESIDRLFIKSNLTDAGKATVKLSPSSTAQLTVSGRTISGYLLPNLSSYTTYSSNNTSIATVNSSGLVTAVAGGIAKISATVTKNGIVKTVELYINVSGSTPTPTPVASNLLLNPGFESVDASWDSWGNSGAVTGNAYSGSYSMRVGTGAGGRAQNIYSGFTVGQSYTLSGYGKISVGTEGAEIGVKCMSSSDAILGQYKVSITSGTYTQQSVTFTVPAGTSYLQPYLWKGPGTNYLYVDDMVLTQAGGTTPTNVIQNPGFENGTTSWTGVDATITAVTSDKTSGSYSCKVSGRGGFWGSARQNVTLYNNTTYNVSAWAKLASGSYTGRITAEIVVGGVTYYRDLATATLNSTGWTNISGQYTFNEGGSITSAKIYVQTNTGTVDLYIDDLSMTVQ